MAANARRIMTLTLRTFHRVSIMPALPNLITLPRMITMLDEFDTDWIDDLLSDDSPEYDDLTNETIDESYQGDYE
jgi:hypothetical protein